MGRQVIPETEPIWKALADPTRRKLLDLLRNGPKSTTQLCESFPTTRFTIMGHLDVLVETGLVVVERRGRERLNHLNPVPLQQLYERWIAPLSGAAASTLLALATAAESEETPIMTPSVDIRAEHLIHSDVTRTWASLMNLAAWWPKCWPDAECLVFEPRLGGRLATLPQPSAGSDQMAEGTLWGQVAEIYPERALALSGPMGLRGPVAGYWRMEMHAENHGTRVMVHHQIIGPVTDDDRACFETGWSETLTLLAVAAEARQDG